MAKKPKLDKKEKVEINRSRNLKQYWKFVKPHRSFLFVIVFLVALMEGIGFIDKWLFKILIDNGTSLSSGALSSAAFMDILWIILSVYVVSHLGYTLFEWIELHLRGKMETRIQYDLKKSYFEHILDLDHDFHTTHKTGSLISRLARANGAMERLNHVILYMILPFIIQVIILSAVFLYFSLWQALIVFLFSVIYLVNSFIVTRRFEPWKNFENKKVDKEKGLLADLYTNIASIRYFGKNKRIKDLFASTAQETREATKNAWHYWRWAAVPGNLIRILGPILLLIIPINEFINGNISLGTVTFVYTAYISFLGALRNFSNSVREFGRAMTDMQDLFDYGEIDKVIKDKPNAKKTRIKTGEVIFEDVVFGYDESKNIFEKFNLKIPKNKTVALVGQSGCGKSTLINLLYRFYDVQEGKIKVDGKDIRDYPQENLRSEMAIVPQEAILFDDTIFNNVKFAKPSATKQEVKQAMKFAQLDKFVDSMPNKENTIVGERGVKLSGGQKQRVSIARALLANKKILVLDEATSALDSETEWEIQKDLEKLMKGRTSIIIAHRLSTIMHADMIVVMKEGKILQKGTHRELITEGGEYAKLWEFQKGGFID